MPYTKKGFKMIHILKSLRFSKFSYKSHVLESHVLFLEKGLYLDIISPNRTPLYSFILFRLKVTGGTERWHGKLHTQSEMGPMKNWSGSVTFGSSKNWVEGVGGVSQTHYTISPIRSGLYSRRKSLYCVGGRVSGGDWGLSEDIET